MKAARGSVTRPSLGSGQGFVTCLARGWFYGTSSGISTGICCLAGPGLVLRDIPLTTGICYQREFMHACMRVFIMMALAGWQAPALAVSR